MKFLPKKLLISLVAAGLFAGCKPAKKSTGNSPESRPEVKAVSEIGQSFQILGDESLTISKTALNREFLLESAISKLNTTADFNSFRGRVVAFARAENYLFLLEATAGHLISDYHKPEQILLRFPILGEDAQTIRFRFSDGAQRLFDSSTYRTGGLYDRPKEFETTQVAIPKLREQRLSGRHLIIRLSSQIELGNAGGSVDTIQSHFFLSPYRPKKDFPRLVSRNFRGYGFYQTPPLREDSDDYSLSYAIKFDISKPIKFYISANTPEEVRPAIRRGIEYWNRIDPRLQLIVEIAPPGVSAPTPGMNIIDWVKWDTSNSAHADFSVDPRTGEILSASIFLTSNFRYAALKAIHYAGRPLAVSAPKSMLPGAPLNYERICGMENLGALPLPTKYLSPEEVQRAVDYFLMETVAHEIGHALGLRHNFAASRGTNIRKADRDKYFHMALAQELLPANVQPATAVMDYVPVEDAVIMMAKSDQSGKALPHDELAIRKLYFNEENPQSRLAFCHDGQTDTYVDCLKWDSGALIAESVASMFELGLGLQQANLLWAFVDFKARPAMRHVEELAEVDPDDFKVEGAFHPHNEFRARLLGNFTRDVDSIAYRAQRPRRMTVADFEEENPKMLDYFAKDIKESGGFSVPFRVLDQKWVEATVRDFMLLLREDRGNLIAHGKNISFTPAERTLIRKKVRHFYTDLIHSQNENLFASAQKLSSEAKPLLDHAFTDNLLSWLRNEVFRVVTEDLPGADSPEWTEKVWAKILIPKDEDEDKKKKPAADTFRWESFEFATTKRAFPLQTRLAALAALKSIHAENPYWSEKLQEDFKAELSCYYEWVFQSHSMDQIDAEQTTKRFQRWFLEESQVSKAILGQ